MMRNGLTCICKRCGKTYLFKTGDVIDARKVKNNELIYCTKCRIIMKLLKEK